MHYLIRKMHIFALRGYLSYNKFRNLNGVTLSKQVAIGDPGLLCCELLDFDKIEKKYDLGIIPHHYDKGSIFLKNIKVRNSKILDIQEHPLKFLHNLAECRSVISSALHGLIAADSLGIPNLRMICSNKIHGGDWKYDDYYSAFDVKTHKRIILSKQNFTEKDLTTLTSMPRKKIELICKQLKDNFPLS